jgi:ferredoxin-NADP reductase
MIITIDNKLYDITEFIKEHPGGSEVFKNGSDMTEDFNQVGHSKEAIKMLEKYLVKTDKHNQPIINCEKEEKEEKEEEEEKEEKEEEEINLDNISIYEFLFYKFNNSKFSKLFTHEDYLNMHKIFGFITLCNVSYSLFDLYYSGCKGVFTLRKIHFSFFILLIIQLLLSLSSLQFKIPINSNYTTISIGEEYRLHSILFVIRHFLIIVLLYFFGNNLTSHIFVTITVLLNMYFADLTSNYFKPLNDNLGFKIASLPFWSGCSDIIQSIITNIYTQAQIYVTFLLISGHSNIEINLAAIFVIQVTAFMGTLSRKGIINNFHWHLIYLLQYLLIIIAFIGNSNIISLKNYVIVFILWTFRTKLNVNKFFLWSCVGLITVFTKYIQNNTILIMCLFILYNIFNYFNLCFDKKRETNHNIVEKNIIIENTKLHLINIKPKNNIEYKSGQYFNLYIDKEKRPYTPINFNIENNTIDFLIKDYGNNKISEKICALKKGMCIHLDGPFGKNYYDKEIDSLFINETHIDKKNILMFYCGTGITPFYSILKNVNEKTKYKFKLFGSLHNKSENCFTDIKQKLFYGDNKLTPQKINKIISKYRSTNTIILLCGTENYNNMILNTIKETFVVYKW